PHSTEARHRRSAAVVPRLRLRLRRTGGLAMFRLLALLLGQLLLHHRPAVLVRHDLLVSHAVALADGPLREILVLGLGMGLTAPVIRLRVMGCFRMMTRLRLM